MNQNEQMRELEAKVRAQANLIKAMEQKQSYLSAQKAKWEEATRTLESEREANRILTEELEQAKQTLAAEPAPLVRLSRKEIEEMMDEGVFAMNCHEITNAIMDALEAKNGGKV